MNNQNHLQHVAYAMIIIVAGGWILYISGSILMPLIFGSLFAIFLYPIDKVVRKYVKYPSLSIPLSFLAVLLPIALVGVLFSMQLVEIVNSLPSIGSNLQVGIDKAFHYIDETIPFLSINSSKILSDNIQSILTGPLNVLGKGILSSSSFMVATILTFIYTFLILYYRRSLRNFVVFQFEKRLRPEIREVLSSIKEIVQSYVGGLGMVIILLSVANSLGLYLIGVDYAIFWGALAGLLAVIPYIGTALGGLLPFLYCLATAEHTWQPIAVVLYYAFIQTLEGNILTPKIVGDKVNINPLVAILAIVIFGSLWGVGGVILALPLISIIRIILSHFDETESVAILMSSTIADDAKKFEKIADD